MTHSGKALPDTFLHASALRDQDRYPADMDWQALVHDFYPDSVVGMAQSLSNITASFYGLMLEQVGELYGPEQINRVSQRMFYRLGRQMAARHMANKPHLERDARGLGRLVAAAIFTSSPEYQLEFLEFSPQRLRMHIKGHDRYHRITRSLGFEHRLEWPVIGAFFQGLGDELGVTEHYALTAQVRELEADSRCDYAIACTPIV